MLKPLKPREDGLGAQVDVWGRRQLAQIIDRTVVKPHFLLSPVSRRSCDHLQGLAAAPVSDVMPGVSLVIGLVWDWSLDSTFLCLYPFIGNNL